MVEALGVDARATPTEDRITLILGVADGRVARTMVSVSRRATAATVLVGQPTDAAVRLVGLLFSLCGTAQTVAALGALEAATARRSSPETVAARQALVLIEALEQGALRMGLDWAALVGLAPDDSGVRALRDDLEALRAIVTTAVSGWDRIGGADDGAVWPPAALADAVGAVSARLGRWVPDAATLSDSVTAIRAWAEDDQSVSARAVALALATPPEPAPNVPPLAGWRLVTFAERLRHDAEAAAFVARPEWRGAAAETGALARCAALPAVAALVTEGAGLAARLVARALDLRRTEAALGALAEGEAPPPTVTGDGPGVGLAAVETARGLLVHRVVVARQRVTAWQIIAPTDWNAHPDGALARTPLGWVATDRAALTRRVHLLALAIDPCVAYDLRFMDARTEGGGHA